MPIKAYVLITSQYILEVKVPVPLQIFIIEFRAMQVFIIKPIVFEWSVNQIV